MARDVRVSAGGVYDLGLHVVWCPKYRRQVLSGQVGIGLRELIDAKAAEHGWRIVACEIMPDHEHLFVKTTPKDSPAFVANQFKGSTSRALRQEFPHLRSRLPTRWSRSYSPPAPARCRRRPCSGTSTRSTSGRGARERPVRRAYKFRVYPTSGQASRMALCLRDHQRMYNAALEERREAWKRRKVSIRYGPQSAQLKDIRACDPEQGRWSFSSQQATLRRLDKAMAAFYRRCKAGQAPGYPRFKARDRWDSVEWPKDGDGCRWKPGTGRMYLQGAGHGKVHAHRAVEGMVKTISLKRAGRRWYVVLSCDDVPARPLPATGRQAGLDAGVARFAATSDGEIIGNPKFPRTSARELAPHSGRSRRRNAGRRIAPGSGRKPPRCTAGSGTAALTSTTRPPELSSKHATRWPWRT